MREERKKGTIKRNSTNSAAWFALVGWLVCMEQKKDYLNDSLLIIVYMIR